MRALLPCLVFASSCNPTVCGAERCDDPGARVVLDHAGWTDGAWTITLTYGEDTLECSFNLPVVDLDGLYCADGRVALTFVDDLPSSAWIAGEPPDEVTARVDHVAVGATASTLLDEVVDVTEGEVFPNGPGCPPGCPTWEFTLRF